MRELLHAVSVLIICLICLFQFRTFKAVYFFLCVLLNLCTPLPFLVADQKPEMVVGSLQTHQKFPSATGSLVLMTLV